MNYQQHLANSAAIRTEIQRFESVHPNIYSIYELLERVEEPLLQNQIREHVIAIEGRPAVLQLCCTVTSVTCSRQFFPPNHLEINVTVPAALAGHTVENWKSDTGGSPALRRQLRGRSEGYLEGVAAAGGGEASIQRRPQMETVGDGGHHVIHRQEVPSVLRKSSFGDAPAARRVVFISLNGLKQETSSASAADGPAPTRCSLRLRPTRRSAADLITILITT
ncbi:Arf-GAP with GTPase, ANK repeat and PH domain-containing protein 1 [Merluccius polli]|uniref:Arf-GAP with GTPase, ANK repeat and PH domain-containing protein 1 n=1 Tax=Merluccius polli TaxID=89951 RepID=A0AA47NSU1_MERPO|nr:Arf-GAP with GTPase, ANK repeat and PH domain-containing protein 1 [Merluccius polli]